MSKRVLSELSQNTIPYEVPNGIRNRKREIASVEIHSHVLPGAPPQKKQAWWPSPNCSNDKSQEEPVPVPSTAINTQQCIKMKEEPMLDSLKDEPECGLDSKENITAIPNYDIDHLHAVVKTEPAPDPEDDIESVETLSAISNGNIEKKPFAVVKDEPKHDGINCLFAVIKDEPDPLLIKPEGSLEGAKLQNKLLVVVKDETELDALNYLFAANKDEPDPLLIKPEGSLERAKLQNKPLAVVKDETELDGKNYMFAAIKDEPNSLLIKPEGDLGVAAPSSSNPNENKDNNLLVEVRHEPYPMQNEPTTYLGPRAKKFKGVPVGNMDLNSLSSYIIQPRHVYNQLRSCGTTANADNNKPFNIIKDNPVIVYRLIESEDGSESTLTYAPANKPQVPTARGRGRPKGSKATVPKPKSSANASDGTTAPKSQVSTSRGRGRPKGTSKATVPKPGSLAKASRQSSAPTSQVSTSRGRGRAKGSKATAPKPESSAKAPAEATDPSALVSTAKGRGKTKNGSKATAPKPESSEKPPAETTAPSRGPGSLWNESSPTTDFCDLHDDDDDDDDYNSDSSTYYEVNCGSEIESDDVDSDEETFKSFAWLRREKEFRNINRRTYFGLSLSRRRL